MGKIHCILSPYPHYVYNEYTSCYFKEITADHDDMMMNHSNDRYLILKNLRKKQLIHRLNIVNKREKERFLLDIEYHEFIDLISCLLDLNPSTRYSSEDAIQHPFCINLKYVENDLNILTILSTKFESEYPIITISNDYDRQYRITQQIEQFDLFQSIKINNPSSVPIPKEMAITRKNNSFVVANRNTQIIHNKVICLLNGCCNNPTKKKEISTRRIFKYNKSTSFKKNEIFTISSFIN